MTDERIPPTDVMGDVLCIGDRVAISVMNSELVVGEVIGLPTQTKDGADYTAVNPKTQRWEKGHAVRVRIEVRGGKYGNSRFNKKTLVYENPSRMVRLEKMDIGAMIADLRATEESLRQDAA